MSRATITVNDTTLIDADLGDWQNNTPPQLTQMMKPAADQPWMRPIVMVLAEAALKNQPITINVTTNGAGWTMHVR